MTASMINLKFTLHVCIWRSVYCCRLSLPRVIKIIIYYYHKVSLYTFLFYTQCHEWNIMTHFQGM